MLGAEFDEGSMVVGTLRVRLVIRESRSLKDKRRVVQGLCDRIRSRFNVSASEVDLLDQRQQAVLGVAVATNDRCFADQVLAKIVDLVRQAPGAALVDYRTELFES